MATYDHAYQAMGSTFRVRVDTWDHANSPHLLDEVGALFEGIAERTEATEQCLSRFRGDSELTLLNQQVGQARTVSPCMKEVLELAQQMMNWTMGAFNPRILSAMEEIGYSGSPIESLANGQLAQRELVSGKFTLYEEIDEGTISLVSPIDLGGIGKGYTADVLADMIEGHFEKSILSGYIVDAGGDIVLSGCQSSGEAWTIGVENPLQPKSLAATITPPLVNWRRAAVCTSSVWRKSWVVDGKKVHHLIDPLTQKPAETAVLSVTAMADSAAVAETVTKYVFLRGTAEAELWNHVNPMFLWIEQDGQMLLTDAISPYISWSAGVAE